MCYPWLLAGPVGPRRSREDKELIAGAFLDAPSELLDSWFAKVLRDKVSEVDDLFSDEWQAALWLWSWEIRTTIAQAEFQHGRNRRRAHRKDTWANFVSKSFNREAALRLERQHRALAQLREDEAPPPASTRATAYQQKRRKKLSAFDIYRFEFIEASKRAGLKFKVASADFWQTLREGGRVFDKMQTACAGTRTRPPFEDSKMKAPAIDHQLQCNLMYFKYFRQSPASR